MNSMGKLNVKLKYLISIIFVLIIGILTMLSIFIHCETAIYGHERTKSISNHTIYIYLGLVVLGISILVVLCRVLQNILRHIKKEENLTRNIFFFCFAIMLIGGVFWIFFNDSVPTYDQKNIYNEARRIAGFSDEPYDIGYFSYFQRNRGIVLFMAAVMKVLGDSIYSFRIINLLAMFIIFYTICKTTKLIFKNPIITSLTEILLMSFYPTVIYTAYHYGTLWSVAFTSLGLWGTVSLCETRKKRYSTLVVFAFPLGILMHQSAAIGLVAAICFLMLNSEKRFLVRNILTGVITIIMIVFLMKTVKISYEAITGADPDASSVPVSCTIYMGLTSSSSGGPGSQDGSYTEIFNQNNQDGKDANEEALSRIGAVVGEYFTGERSLKFFLEKTKYQWLDPTFGARKIIRTNDPSMSEPPNSDTYIRFYNSSFRSIVFKLSIASMLLIYIGALISGIKTICAQKEYPAAMLIQLYVIGGFAFQLLWESLSRYCYNYFIWLIPLAAFGLYLLHLRLNQVMAKEYEF